MRIKRWWAGYLAIVLVVAACAQPDSSDGPDAPATPQSLIPVLTPCPGTGGPTLVFSATHSAGASVDVYGVLPTGTVEPLTDDGKSAWPDFHPEGTSLIFARAATRAGSAGGPPPATALWTIDLKSGVETKIIDVIAAEAPRYSPDGASIAFSGVGVAEEEEQGYRIHTVASDGSGLRRITPSLRSDLQYVSEHEPVWHSDGSRLAFVRVGDSDGDTFSQLWVLDPSTASSELLYETSNSGIRSLSWSSSGLSLVFSVRLSSSPARTAVLFSVETSNLTTLAEDVSNVSQSARKEGSVVYFEPHEPYLRMVDLTGPAPVTTTLAGPDIVPTTPLDVVPCKLR